MGRWIAIVVLILALMILAIYLYGEKQGAVLELKELRAERAQLVRYYSRYKLIDSGTGGAETTSKNRQVPKGAKFAFPIAREDYWLTSAYGDRISPLIGVKRKHEGVDIAAVWRAQIIAVKDGVVAIHYPPPDGYFKGHDVYGGYIVIDHGDSISYYAHLVRTYVHEGQEVSKGEVIGRMGSTGQADGMHLHFELEIGSVKVNPLLYLNK